MAILDSLQFVASLHDLTEKFSLTQPPTQTTKAPSTAVLTSTAPAPNGDMSPPNLYLLLDRVARQHPNNGTLFLEGDCLGSRRPLEARQTYRELLKEARIKSLAIRMRLRSLGKTPTGRDNNIVILHLDGYRESLIWFWAVIAAGAIPVMSLPFKGTADNHAKYVNHIRSLFGEPLIITSPHLMTLFRQFRRTTIKVFATTDVERFRMADLHIDFCFPGANKEPNDVACIMLTSGSTGKSKGVSIKHGMIFRSLEGKSKMHVTDDRDVFLSWTEPSHVANLIEIHLHALSLGANQIQVESHRIVSSPLTLFELVDKHRVSYTFAPNFLLASILKALDESRQINIVEDHWQKLDVLGTKEADSYLKYREYEKFQKANEVPSSGYEAFKVVGEERTRPWDLGCLRAVISGGETNLVNICFRLTESLQEFNAPCSFIRPGFGMTETCAGSTYSLDCPSMDRAQNSEFASVGRPINNAQTRIMMDGKKVETGQVGRLEMSGLVVFDGYYNDPVSTCEAFTVDGWFITGDNAIIDAQGRIHIVGRQKDVICINGIKHHPFVIEAALEQAAIPGMKPSWTVAFGHRPAIGGMLIGTECMCIVYTPAYDHFDIQARIDTLTAISKTIVLLTGIRPYRIIPVPQGVLSKSILGKLSRTEIRIAFEADRYLQFEEEDDRLISNYQKRGRTFNGYGACHHTIAERDLFDGVSDLSADANLFNLGVSSSDLLKLRVRLQANLDISNTFPLTHFFNYPTVRELGAAIDTLDAGRKYDPIVTLRPKTALQTKNPLFFIHPGMGEVLIFMNLARHFDDRPVYALRARGFDGEDFFQSMEEMICCYLSAIRREQPKGPYALAGYSFGSILSFEITKRLIAEGEEVRFLATFDQAPFFKERARGYDWYECVLSVSFFLGLMDEKFAYAEMKNFRKLSREQVLTWVIASAPPLRVEESGMSTARLERWADLALEMKRITWDYDPEGSVPQMDIFYTVPLLGIVKAKSTEEWRYDYIGKWDLLVDKPAYHFVDGGHRTMINPPYLNTFQKTFRTVLSSVASSLDSRTPKVAFSGFWGWG